MNVNHEQNIIWVPSYHTGEDMVIKFLQNTGFISYRDGFDNPQPLSYDNISFKTQIDEFYGTFNIFVTTDNPYRQIVNLHRKSSFINWSLKENTDEMFKESFNNWFKSKSDLYGTFTLFNFLTNPSYEILKNANIIKLDELETKILEYDFVNNNEFIIDFIKTKKRETEKFVDILTFEQAQQVYHNSKQVFDICGYDPFSFTTEKIDYKKQLHFIHNI